MRRLLRTVAVVALAVPALLAVAALSAAELARETRWADPSRVRLDIEFPGNGYHANWELFRCDCGDLLVRSQLEVPGSTERGETVLVGGRALLSRGFGDGPSGDAASLDASALMMQLALRLLERSVPAGPSAVTSAIEVDVEDKINHIHLDTGDAAGSFLAPWSVSGRIVPAGEARRRFDLRFEFHAGQPGEAQQAEMRLSGVADYAHSDFPLAGSSRLEGWELSWRRPEDTAAAAAAPEILQELRELLRVNPD